MVFGEKGIEGIPRILFGNYQGMRDAEPAPDHVRILLTFLTPVDYAVKLLVYQGLKCSASTKEGR
jgi:hypothetical protein